MTHAITHPRIGSDVVVGLALQPGASAVAPTVFLNTENFKAAPNNVDLEFRGTQQTLIKRSSPVRRVAVDYQFDFEAFVNTSLLRLLIEQAFGAAPYAEKGASAAGAGSDALSMSGDTSGVISALKLTNVIKETNTSSSGVIYLSMMVNTSAIIILFNSSAKSAGVIIGSATLSDGSGTVAITEQNDSGLTGSITVDADAATQADMRADVFYQFYPYSTAFSQLMTLTSWDGFEKCVYKNCAVQKITLNSKNGEACMGTLTIKGGARSKTTSAVEGSFLADYYAHNSDLTLMRSDDVSDPYDTELSVVENELSIENTVRSVRANADAPYGQIKQGCAITGKFVGPHGDELNNIFDKIYRTPSEGISWDAVRMSWVVASNTDEFVHFYLGNVHYGMDEKEITGADEQPNLNFDFESYYESTRDAIKAYASI